MNTTLDEQLLEGLDYTVSSDIIAFGKYVDAGVNTYEVAFDLLIDWFADCRKRAGGLDCRYPCYIAHHDSNEYFDLKLRKEVSEDDIWREA